MAEGFSEMNVKEKLNSMVIGEVTRIGYWAVTCVPGGWIFHIGNPDSQTAVFVPRVKDK